VHPRDQLAHAERLGQVVVGADAEPHQDVGLVVAGGQHQHRHGRCGLDPAAHLVAVEAGQHHVEHDQVGRVLRCVPRDRAGAVVRACARVVPLGAQPVGDRLVDHRLVLDDTEPRKASAASCRWPLVASALPPAGPSVPSSEVNRPPGLAHDHVERRHVVELSSGSAGDVDGALGEQHVGPEVAVGAGAPDTRRISGQEVVELAALVPAGQEE
jgi:hypothetical protein